jgi:hypothetical protein
VQGQRSRIPAHVFCALLGETATTLDVRFALCRACIRHRKTWRTLVAALEGRRNAFIPIGNRDGITILIAVSAGDHYGGLMTDYELICEFESLYAAHKKARRGKRCKRDVVSFELDLAHNLCALKERLDDRTYAPSGYYRFMIHDPKDREIQALSYEGRVVQHSICDNVLTPFFENRLIYDNCACRIGKGTHFGIHRLTTFLREHYKDYGADGYVLKADIKKYFPSIDHKVLRDRLQKIIPDQEVMNLLGKIIDSFNRDTERGLPMGNQTSQLFALYYLDPVDRLIKEQMRLKHYTRYMDDMILIHPDREYLQECLARIKACAENELHLKLNDKTQIIPLRQGVDYLGWHFYLTDSGKVVRKLRGVQKRKLRRIAHGLVHRYAAGEICGDDVRRSLASVTGHLKHGNTYRLKARIYDKMVFIKKSD